MASQLAFKSRIASTESLKKIFNAQEMIASSRIAKTRDVALAAKPFSDAIYDAVRSLAAHTNIEHPILGKKEDNPRVAVLALTSDRGMAGAYTSSIIRSNGSTHIQSAFRHIYGPRFCRRRERILYCIH